MLGLILVYDEVLVEAQAVAPDRDFLGAPVLARSLIAAIPADSDVKVVVAVAEKFIERVQADVVRRFGFIEVAAVLPWTGDLATILTRGLEIFGQDCTQVLLHDGRRPLVRQEQLKRLLQAAAESGAAISVREPKGPQLVLDAEGQPRTAPQKNLLVLHPQALSVERLHQLLQNKQALADDLNLLPLLENSSVTTLHADPDNLRIVDERDLSRAVEVWSRRAVEFPFLWPRPERFDAHQRELEQNAKQAETQQQQVEEQSSEAAAEHDDDQDDAAARAQDEQTFDAAEDAAGEPAKEAEDLPASGEQ